MTKRAKALAVGDVLAEYGAVTAVAIHNTEKRPRRSDVGAPNRKGPRPVFAAKVVEIRTTPHLPPIYRWPNDRLEVVS